jgi:hypothetical protein
MTPLTMIRVASTLVLISGLQSRSAASMLECETDERNCQGSDQGECEANCGWDATAHCPEACYWECGGAEWPNSFDWYFGSADCTVENPSGEYHGEIVCVCS